MGRGFGPSEGTAPGAPQGARPSPLTPHPSPESKVRRALLRAALAGVAATTLAGCGFELRRPTPLPFESLHVAAPGNSAFAAELRRAITATGPTELRDDPKGVEAIVAISNESRQRQILSLSGAGTVREYQIIYQVTVRITDAAGTELVPATEIQLRRDYTFNASQALAKEQEEALLFRDMIADAVRQVMRRLRSAKAS